MGSSESAVSRGGAGFGFGLRAACAGAVLAGASGAALSGGGEGAASEGGDGGCAGADADSGGACWAARGASMATVANSAASRTRTLRDQEILFILVSYGRERIAVLRAHCETRAPVL